MQLPPDDSVVMVSGHPPIKARKLRYYLDRNFTRRMLRAPSLAERGYLDRPAARPDDWSHLAAATVDPYSSAMNMGGFADEGGHQLKPELNIGSAGEREVDAGDLMVLDDEDDAPLRPQDVARQFTRTARLAAQDPDDGIAL